MNIRPIRKIADLPGDLDELMLHFWECEIISGVMILDLVELNQVGWFTIEQMKQMDIYPATKKLFREYLGEDL